MLLKFLLRLPSYFPLIIILLIVHYTDRLSPGIDDSGDDDDDDDDESI